MTDTEPATNRSADNEPFDDARSGNTPVDGEPTGAVASGDDDALENIAESMPGAGTLHDGENERTRSTSDGVTDNDDPAIPSRPAPLG